MKKIIWLIMLMLVCSNAYAYKFVIPVDEKGNELGTASNPMTVSAAGGSGFCLSDGTNCPANIGVGTVNPGTTNFVSKYVNQNTIDDSALIFDNGTNVGIGTITPLAKFAVGTGSPFQVSSLGKVTSLNIVDDANENIALGSGAIRTGSLGTKNTAIGANALQAPGNTDWNTAIGWNAMSGPLSTSSASTGHKNTMVGGNGMINITTGYINTSIGYHSMEALTSGNSNSALGVDALHNNETGSANTATGYAALLALASADYNTAVGANALNLLTTGTQNAALGYRAGGAQVTGNNNVFLGEEAGYGGAKTDLSNSILIGQGTALNFSNTVRIGNTSITNVAIGHGIPTLTLSLEGDAAQSIGMEREINSAQHGKALTVTAGGSVPVGTITNFSSTPTAGGSGYVAGDTFTIDGGTTLAQGIVTTVSGGACLTVARITNGAGYTAGSGKATTATSGAGTGCTVNITSVATATDRNGGDLNLKSGTTTGTGTSAVRIFTATPGSTGSTDNAPSEKLTILGNGNVGIGTLSPASILAVNAGASVGQVTIDGGTGGCIVIRDTDDAGWTECDALDGTLSCSTDADGICD